MSHKPLVYSEKPIKPRTVDRMHKKAHDALNQAVSRPLPMKPGKTGKLNKLELKKG